MAFGINEILAATANGLAREAHFELVLNPPSSVSSNSQMLSIMCTAASIPNKRADVRTMKRYGYGLATPFIAGAQYSPLEVMFYADVSGTVFSTISNWFDLSMPTKTSTGAMLMNYSDTYSGAGQLIQYDPTGNVIATITFDSLFPVSVGPINHNWAATDNLVLIPATFAYTYYSSNASTGSLLSIGTTALQTAPITNLPVSSIISTS